MNRRQYIYTTFTTLITAVIAACRKDIGRLPVIKKITITDISPNQAVANDIIKVSWAAENIKTVSVFTRTLPDDWQLVSNEIDAALGKYVIKLPTAFITPGPLSIKVSGDEIDAVKNGILKYSSFMLDASQYPELATVGGMQNMTIGNNDVFVKRESASEIKCFSSVCTHAGCIISFIKPANKFNCSCHGSQFDPNGSVLQGPALAPLNTYYCEALGSNKFRILY